MGSAHYSTEVNIWPKFRENPLWGKGDTEWTKNSRLKPVTLNCDLVSLHGWAIGSAHHFTEANIWPKLKENPSRGKGDIEWTRNSGLKLGTLICDLVFKSPWLSYGFCRSSHRWTFDQSLAKILPGVKEIQSGHEIQGSNPWPWSWVSMVKLLILHIVSLRWTFDQSLKKKTFFWYRIYRGDTKFKAQTCDPELWPWPCVGMVELWVMHIVSLGQTYDQSLNKILPGV